MTGFETLRFTQAYDAAPDRLWRAWTDPQARMRWSAPNPDVTVEFLEWGTREGGREVSLCRVKGAPDVRCEVGWIAVEPPLRTVNTEVLFAGGDRLAAALVTALVEAEAAGSRLTLTVQLASLAADMAPGYRQGFPLGLANIGRELRRRLA